MNCKKIIPLLVFVNSLLFSQIDPNLDNRFRLALDYEQAAKFDKAESIYRELLNLQSWNVLYFESLNKILIKQKKYDESISLLENRIQTIPADISLYGMLGSTYYMMENYEMAFNSWERGIQTNKNSYIVYRVIANYAIENRTYEKAIEILQRGKIFTPDPSLFSFDLANLFSINMRFEDAANEYCNLLLIKPDQISTVKGRLLSYFDRHGALQQTIGTIHNFLKENKQPVFFDLLSYCYTLSGNYSEAFETIKQYDRLTNGNGNPIFIFAQEAFRNRKYQHASSAFKFLTITYQTSPLLSLAKIGLLKSFEEDLNLRISSITKDWRPLQQKKIYFQQEYENLIKEYSHFLKETPDNTINPEANFRMAEIYFNRLLNYKKADSIFQSVVSSFPNSGFAASSIISIAEISVLHDNLDEAESNLNQWSKFPNADMQTILKSKFLQAKILFWKGSFSASLILFKEITNNLSSDISNDAIEYASLINFSKKDSLSLMRFAIADKLVFQNKLKEAAIEFKTLGDNSNLFIINEFAKFRLAEIFLSENEYELASEILIGLTDNSKTAIFADKSTYLLALTYHYGINDPIKAEFYYQKLLEKFPNSLYFDKARENLNSISKK
jgi:tetratricopeptide (TPR) repeat protein